VPSDILDAYMKKNILIALGAIVIISAGWYFYNVNKYQPSTYVKETPTGTVTVNTKTDTTTAGSPTFTLEAISAHKDATSCYSAINGTIYDLTAWVNMHPGGKGPILSVCGKDGSDVFMKKHNGGAKYMTVLTRYKIGTLTQ
jgi:predicted heme/steroid binding protein